MDMTYGFKRTSNIDELLCDSSITACFIKNFSDWKKFIDYYKSVDSMPLNRTQKQSLKPLLWGSLDLTILRLDNPKFYVYRWDDDELRWFITTRGGYLIEPEYNSLWD